MRIPKSRCAAVLFTAVALWSLLACLPVLADEAGAGDYGSEQAAPDERKSAAGEQGSSGVPVADETAPGDVASSPETPPPEAWEATSPPSGLSPPPAYLERYSRGFKIDPREFTFTQRYFWSRLIHPTRSDALWGAGVFGLAVTLARGRYHIQDEVQESGTPERSAFFGSAQTLGDQGVIPGIALLFYLGGSTFNNYRAKETGLMLAESALLTGILTAAGQYVLSEDRPSNGGGFRLFDGFGHGVSGHASTAASMSGVLASMYLRDSPGDGAVRRTFKWIGKGAAYGAPLLVAYARVDRQQHFAYNTVLGVGIGFWVSHVVADAHEAYMEDPHPRWKLLAVGPISDEEGAVGFGAKFDFQFRPQGR